MKEKKEAFINLVNYKIREMTAGPGGSFSLNEEGRSAVGRRYDAGEYDAFVVANDIVSSVSFNILLVADWEDGWFG